MTPLKEQTKAEQIMEWAQLNQHNNRGAMHIVRTLSLSGIDKCFESLLDAKRWAARCDKRYRDEQALAGNRFGV